LVASILNPTAPPALVFLTGLVLSATVGALWSALSAAGEELGWRGYMLTRLIEAGVPRPVLVSGIVWGLWHVPLILGGVIYNDHPSKVVATLVFLVSVVSMGFVVARARLETGSIWPPIALHGAYNSVIQSAFSPATTGPEAPVWVGQEAGLLVAATLAVAAVLVCRGQWAYRRTPDEPRADPT
jgi:membrane protease YdiL (CAAX protease family)